MDGPISLIEPNFDNVHEPILLGKLNTAKNGSFFQDDLSDVTTYRLYNSEGVSFPLGGQFSFSGFGRTLVFGPSFQKSRPLSNLECWALIGGTIVPPPKESYEVTEFGKLFPHFNP